MASALTLIPVSAVKFSTRFLKFSLLSPITHTVRGPLSSSAASDAAGPLHPLAVRANPNSEVTAIADLSTLFMNAISLGGVVVC
jgi:hypothetical protein